VRRPSHRGYRRRSAGGNGVSHLDFRKNRNVVSTSFHRSVRRFMYGRQAISATLVTYASPRAQEVRSPLDRRTPRREIVQPANNGLRNPSIWICHHLRYCPLNPHNEIRAKLWLSFVVPRCCIKSVRIKQRVITQRSSHGVNR
jgi:hypothetical protein